MDVTRIYDVLSHGVSPPLGSVSAIVGAHSSLDKRYMFVQAETDVPLLGYGPIKDGFQFEYYTNGKPAWFIPGKSGINATGKTIKKGQYFWLQTQGPIEKDGKEWYCLYV